MKQVLKTLSNEIERALIDGNTNKALILTNASDFIQTTEEDEALLDELDLPASVQILLLTFKRFGNLVMRESYKTKNTQAALDIQAIVDLMQELEGAIEELVFSYPELDLGKYP